MLTARAAAAVGFLLCFSLASLSSAFCSLASSLPTRASFALDERCRASATSSRQAFASLSTRVGRLASRSKLTEHRLDAIGAGGGGGGGGGGGAITLTLVVADIWCPLSSDTPQVTVIGPGAAPPVESVAEGVVPLMEPAVAL